VHAGGQEVQRVLGRDGRARALERAAVAAGEAAVALVALGLALIVLDSGSLPAVIGGILAITAAAFLALRG
jgi:hypothetical protein